MAHGGCVRLPFGLYDSYGSVWLPLALFDFLRASHGFGRLPMGLDGSPSVPRAPYGSYRTRWISMAHMVL
jgi:hypothetical protein